MKSCCVVACTSESYGGCNISFHSFPKDEDMRQKWLKHIHVKQKITKYSVVCSRHFEPYCFYSTYSRKLLKTDAIPTISPLAKKEQVEDISNNIWIPETQLLTFEEEILRPDTPEETQDVMAGKILKEEKIEEPPRQKLCLNVKEVGLQAKKEQVEDISNNIWIPETQLLTFEEEILRPDTPEETQDVMAGKIIKEEKIEEPPRQKLCLNVKEVGVQTIPVQCTSPKVDDLKRKVKILSQRLKRRNSRIKELEKRCKHFEKLALEMGPLDDYATLLIVGD